LINAVLQMVCIHMRTSQDQRSDRTQNNRGENCSQSVHFVDKLFKMGGIFKGCNVLLFIRYVNKINALFITFIKR
jgi:hypothetical protein